MKKTVKFEHGFISKKTERQRMLESWRQRGFRDGKMDRARDGEGVLAASDSECLAAYRAGLRVGRRERARS